MCVKRNPNLLLIGIPLKNLIMVGMNLEDKEPTKMSWFSKEGEAKERGLITFVARAYPLVSLGLFFYEDDGALNERKRMGLLKEMHHINRGRLKVRQLGKCTIWWLILKNSCSPQKSTF